MVNEHLDFKGATGSSYRFRRADPRSLPATAGNFLCVRMGDGGPEILACGAAGTLVEASRSWLEAEQHGAEALYVRLNVAGSVRAQEFEDLVGAAKPALVFPER